MGFTTLLVLAIVGAAFAQDLNYLNPVVELKSEFEFLSGNTNLDEPKYRLLDTVQPHYVYLDLDVYLDEYRFDGVVTHEVTVQQTGLSQIVMHQNVVRINSIHIVNSANQQIPLNTTNPFETDSYYEVLKINLANAIIAGNYTITIRYLGRINENPVDRGFYMGYYFYNNQKRLYATTQFQPFHARKAFPCFDEPQFKSRYTISITRASSLSQSYSNMAINETVILGNRTRETFLPTPIISSYLIAFHVSDFVETRSTSTVARPFGIISRPGATDQHQFAAEMGFDITQELDEYLNINYHDMGQGQPMKNDHIALPDFPSGAMENWGMVNYREAFLLYDPQNTNIINKIFISSIVAHEMAHKWFGNLVTNFWWCNLWLNEAFATYFEYFAPEKVDPYMELRDQFVVDNVQSALAWDAFASAPPMNWSSVANNPSISAHFSTTSYAKGASVLRMMEFLVGERNFRTALRYYLRDNAYGIGTPELLYSAFRTAVSEDRTFASRYPGIDVGDVMDTWVQNPGSPVVHVNHNTTTGVVTITQERFLLNGSDPDALWSIPISYTHSAAPNFWNETPSFVMTGRNATIQIPPGEHFIVLNVRQSGLYRVRYDDASWRRMGNALRENRFNITYLNKSQMVNDIFYFLRAGTMSFEVAFDFLDYMYREEVCYFVWTGALSQMDWLRRRLIHLPRVHDEYTRYITHLMSGVMDFLSYTEREEDKTSNILNRMQIMNYACNVLHHQGCREYSLRKWNEYRQNNSRVVNVNERRYVYCVGLKEGNASDYQFLFQQYNSSENAADMVVMLRALACTNDSLSIQHYLEQSLYNDRIRIHDKTNAFNFALQGPPENLNIILNFLFTRYQDIRTWYGGVARLNMVVNALTAHLNDFTHITMFQMWLYSNQLNLDPSTFNAGVSVLNAAVDNLSWGNMVGVEVFEETRRRNSAATFVSPMILLVVALFAHLLK